MSRDTTADDSRLTRRQRHVAIALAVVCIVLTSAALVAAQSGPQTLDDFESGNVNNWSLIDGPESGTGSVEIETDVVAQGDFAMDVNDSGTTGHTGASYDNFPIAGHRSLATRWNYTAGQTAWLNVHGNNGQLFSLDDRGGGWTLDSGDVTLPYSSGYMNVIITFDYDNEQSTVYIVDGGDVQGEDTLNWTGGEGSTEITGISYNSLAGSLYIDDVRLNTPIPGDLSLDAGNYMRPGTSQQYGIEFTPSGSNTTTDVTDNATLTSSDNDTLTVYDSNNTVVSTADRNALPDTVTLTAEYDDFQTSTNVTIAEPSVDNLDLLPVWWKVNATVGDGMMLWLIVATLAAVVATRGATSFAGVGAYVMIMICGWIAGPVSDGVMIAAILTGLFLGMNLAANVDTTIRGTG